MILIPVSNINLNADIIGHWKLDDGQGNVAVDSSGNGHTGTVNGNPSWTTGKHKGALHFDGNNDVVNIGNPADGTLDFSETESFSILLWAKIPVNLSKEMFLLSKVTNAGKGYFIKVAKNGRLHATIGDQSYEENLCGIPAIDKISDNNWHHIALTVDRSNEVSALYIDGKQIRSKTIAHIGTLNNGNSLYLGRRQSNYMTGSLDDVQIHDTALSAEDIEKTVIGNLPPSIDAISDHSVEETCIIAIGIHASDVNEQDILTLSSPNIPSFCNLHDRGDGTGLIVSNPGEQDAGQYPITIVVEDSFLNQVATAFTLTVEDF